MGKKHPESLWAQVELRFFWNQKMSSLVYWFHACPITDHLHHELLSFHFADNYEQVEQQTESSESRNWEQSESSNSNSCQPFSQNRSKNYANLHSLWYFSLLQSSPLSDPNLTVWNNRWSKVVAYIASVLLAEHWRSIGSSCSRRRAALGKHSRCWQILLPKKFKPRKTHPMPMSRVSAVEVAAVGVKLYQQKQQQQQ